MAHTSASLAAASLAALLLLSDPRAPAVTPPKLAVILVVDQMRADYLDRFRRDWTGGLARLLAEGAWFTDAKYPYLNTVTCSGHATVATGAFPHAHGITSNQWWDRDAARQMSCTEDPRARNIGYDGEAKEQNSGYRLLLPTFADRMRTERGAHVVTLSAKARSAIMLAGHGGDAVTWLSERVETWLTSSAFASAPVPSVMRFISQNPIDRDFGQRWTRLLPLARYRTADESTVERPPPGWTATFPHVLTGSAGAPDLSFRAQWDISPFADAYLGRMAGALVEELHLGQHDGTDVLGVSFTATDRVGHKFGPHSQEIQDQLARLDRTLGALLARLDASVGRGQYVIALTADHGVTPSPEELTARGEEGGRLKVTEMKDMIEAALGPSLGAGPHVTMLDGRDMNLYFAPGVYERLRASPPILDDVIRRIVATPGIAAVFRSEELERADRSPDPWRRAAALSYRHGRSGDLVIAPRRGWIGSVEAASHGTASLDDQRVPILLMGQGIKPGRYTQPVTPADIAPTLAAVCGVTLPAAEGHALRVALR